MKSNGTIHFAKTISRSAADVGQPVDSGNGYYSYSYTDTPYTGDASTDKAKQNIHTAIRNKWFKTYSIFNSCGGISIIPNESNTGGVIRVTHTYHHGD